MEKLKTPFGEIDILIDGTPIPYVALKGSKDEHFWPDVENRYRIIVEFVPDGKKHNIACVFSPICEYERGYESGERLECQWFYNDQRIKMSIGITGDGGYLSDGTRVSYYDYDYEYLENGMAYTTLTDTKTEKYVFGIAWLDDVGWDDAPEYYDDLDGDNSNEGRIDRDTQTWNAADPFYPL